MIKQAFVHSRDKDGINVIVIRESACGHNCASCSGSCETKPIDMKLKTDLDIRPGQFIDLEISSKSMIILTLFVYLFPLISFGLGFYLSNTSFSKYFSYSSDLMDILVAFIFLTIAFLIVKIVDKKVKKENFIKIVR